MSNKAEKILALAENFEKNAKTLHKEADAASFHKVLSNYEKNSEAVRDFATALKKIAEDFKSGSDMSDPVQSRIFELLMKQASIVENCLGDLEWMDSEIDELANESSGPASVPEEPGNADDLIVEAKKLDPKAKARNRGTVCVPAEKAKDKKDHFPINSEDQARNALARVNQYSSVPEWYSGSLQSLVDLVARKVKSKYPSIEVSKDAKKPGKKKAYIQKFDSLITKFAQDVSWNPSEQNEEDAKNFMAGKPSTRPKTDPTFQGNSGKWGTTQEQQAVVLIQQYLRDQKYNIGATGADGKLGPATQQALKQFQSKNGLPADGQLNAKTLEFLGTKIPTLSKVVPTTQQQANQVAAPIDIEKTKQIVTSARGWIDFLNKSFQSGKLKDPQTASNAGAQVKAFLDPKGPWNLQSLVQSINGLIASPNIADDQKEQLKTMQFEANDMLMAFKQWEAVLSGQFAQTGQIPGVNQTAKPTPGVYDPKLGF